MVNNNIILIEEYKKKIDSQEKLIAEQSFKLNDFTKIINRLNEDIENLSRIIKKQAAIDPVDSMEFKE